MGVQALWDTAGIAFRLLLRGQTNFLRMLWKFSGLYNAERLDRDHHREIRYALRLPEGTAPRREKPSREELYVHHPTAVAAERPTSLRLAGRGAGKPETEDTGQPPCLAGSGRVP